MADLWDNVAASQNQPGFNKQTKPGEETLWFPFYKILQWENQYTARESGTVA